MTPEEGYIDFQHAAVSCPCRIWYKICGPWPIAGSVKPLLTLHGGPGYTHDYMLPLQDLCNAPLNVTVIFFDQLGSGKSTHFRDKLYDNNFWTEEFFLDQVTAVLKYLKIRDNYDLLGHSWGGMLATIHAARQPQGLKRLIIANAPVASIYWKYKYHEYRDLLPERYRDVLKQTRTTESNSDPVYLEALQVFYKRHFINLDPIPVELEKSWKEIEEDPTASLSTLGPDEFEMSGSLANFTAVEEVRDIKAKTLVVTGVGEGSDHGESIKIFKQIADCQHITFQESTHFPHLEQRSDFMAVIAGFL